MNPRLSHAATQDADAARGRRPRSERRARLWRDRRAVTAVEYAVIAGVMVFVVFTVSSPFAVALGNMFNNVTNSL